MTGPFQLYGTTVSDASEMDATGPIDGYKHVPREFFSIASFLLAAI